METQIRQREVDSRKSKIMKHINHLEELLKTKNKFQRATIEEIIEYHKENLKKLR